MTTFLAWQGVSNETEYEHDVRYRCSTVRCQHWGRSAGFAQDSRTASEAAGASCAATHFSNQTTMSGSGWDENAHICQTFDSNYIRVSYIQVSNIACEWIQNHNIDATHCFFYCKIFCIRPIIALPCNLTSSWPFLWLILFRLDWCDSDIRRWLFSSCWGCCCWCCLCWGEASTVYWW